MSWDDESEVQYEAASNSDLVSFSTKLKVSKLPNASQLFLSKERAKIAYIIEDGQVFYPIVAQMFVPLPYDPDLIAHRLEGKLEKLPMAEPVRFHFKIHPVLTNGERIVRTTEVNVVRIEVTFTSMSKFWNDENGITVIDGVWDGAIVIPVHFKSKNQGPSKEQDIQIEKK